MKLKISVLDRSGILWLFDTRSDLQDGVINLTNHLHLGDTVIIDHMDVEACTFIMVLVGCCGGTFIDQDRIVASVERLGVFDIAFWIFDRDAYHNFKVVPKDCGMLRSIAECRLCGKGESCGRRKAN